MSSDNLLDHTRFKFDEVLQQDLLSSSEISYNYNDTILTTENNNIHCDLKNNTFSANLLRNRFTDQKILMIICVKDSAKLLDYSIQKLQSCNIKNYCDILIVDDRTQSNDILDISDKYSLSYLKVQNIGNIFNYSVLNNIAACYAKILDKEKIIFYNNDVWPENEKTIINLINKHNSHKADISGCKLLYPSQEEMALFSDNQHLLFQYLEMIQNTIQHGGIFFTPKISNYIDKRRYHLNNGLVLGPSHLWRFYNQNTIMASQDVMCYAVTGAFQIVNTNSFFRLDGFNQGLSSSFQDIDLCIKAFKKGMKIYYFGSEYLYHAESLTIAKDKIQDTQGNKSDNNLWDYLWGIDISTIIGYQNA